MDAGASVIAFITLATTVANQLQKAFVRLKNAPEEIVALLEEVQSIRMVFTAIREKGKDLAPWIDNSALNALSRNATRELDATQRFLAGLISENSREELRFNRVGWFRKKEEAEKLLRRLESIRNNAVAILSCANLSANVHVALSVRSIADTLNDQRLEDAEILTSVAQFQATTSAGIVAIEERFRRFAIEPPPEDYSRLLQENEGKTTENVSTSSLAQYNAITSIADVTQPLGTMPSFGCPINCTCKCHKKYGLRSPSFVSPLIGRINIIYTGASIESNPCSSRRCSRYRGFMLNMNYSFPRWLLYRMLYVLGSTMGDPTFVLSAPRVISQDAGIFEMARLGDIQGMQQMFAHRWASPLVITEHGETLIQETIHNGFPEAARFLIRMGANPEIENDVGVLPAQEAWDYILRRGHPEKVLEEYRVIFELDESDLAERGFTIIHRYVLGLEECHDFAKALEVHRAMINVVDRLGRTAAHWAVLRNDAEKLKHLLQMGTDPHIKDGTWGNNLLDYSVRCPSADLTKMLLRFGADPNTRTTCKWTPLYGCGTYRKSKIPEVHVENARLLIENGADINARDEDGVDALIKATRQEIPLLAAFLLDAGAEINTWDNEGVCALAYAIRRQSSETLKVLLDRGADYLYKDKRDNTILHAAAAEADLETLHVLQRYGLYGLDPDARNGKGLTAIETANQREDMPQGFLPVLTELCADARASSGKNGNVKGKHTTKVPSFQSSQIEEEKDTSEDEYEDAMEF